MASMLPNPDLLPRFRTADGSKIPLNEHQFPREVRDFVVYSQTWAGYIAQPNQRTIRGILDFRDREWTKNCFTCEQNWDVCPKEACVRVFHAQRRAADYTSKFEIQPAGTMGLGVFAGRHLLQGEILDEYFGELLPPIVAAQRNDDDYSFAIQDVASSSARDYGNWTRFVNHRCVRFNVEATDDVLGGRRTITFRALRNIRRGTQLFIDYGTGYFGDADNYILCRCPDFPPDHLPPQQRGTKRKADTQATPTGRPKRRQNTGTRKRPDLTIPEKNAWITTTKQWLNQEEPNGYSHWTILHWRFLEQLIRRRRNYADWRNKPEFRQLTSSRDDMLINSLITTTASDTESENRINAQMTIKEWHLDVTKAFAKDEVCGSKQGVPWGTDELLRRVFALVVAARRRNRRAGRRNSRSTTPTGNARPVTPKPAGGAFITGDIPTPPPTQRPQRPQQSGTPGLPPTGPPAKAVPGPTGGLGLYSALPQVDF